MKPRRQTSPTLTLVTSFCCLAVLAFSLLNFDINVSSAQGQVQVNAADPASTAQGTINLNVKVTGKGFKNGAKAKWFVTGTTDPGGVTVNSTTFVNGSEVTANITVADTAAIANFDIQVANPDGRGGKGTELFSVTANGNAQSATSVVALRVTLEATDSTATACRICSDGLGEYVDGLDGVSASFTKNGFLSIAFQNSATLRTVNFDYTFPGNPGPIPVIPVVKPSVTSQVYPTRLQDMSYGMTQCIGLAWSYTDGGNVARSHAFQFGPHANGSSYGIATCTAAGNPGNTGPCIQWTIEPKQDGVCNANASAAGVNDRITVRRNTTDNYYGVFKMPFKLTLNKK